MAPKEFCQGRWGRVVFATTANGACPAEEFFEKLSAKDQTKLTALLKLFADQGEIRNREKFKKVEDGLFEFKSFQIRMLCFLEAKSVVLTHGCIKKRNELGKAEIQRAERIKAEHKSKVLPMASNKGTQGLKKI